MAAVAADLIAEDYGSSVLIRGITDRGHAWIEEHCSGDRYQSFGPGARIVEPRYVFAILKGAITDGLVVA